MGEEEGAGLAAVGGAVPVEAGQGAAGVPDGATERLLPWRLF
jgi:hypothetical protein